MLYLFQNIKKKLWFKRALKKGLKCGKNSKFSLPIYSCGLKNISIGKNFSSGPRLKLKTFTEWNRKLYAPQISIGNNVTIESDCHISAINYIEIDDNVLIASFVYISDHSHGIISKEELKYKPIDRDLYSKGPIKIGKNVWIGEKVSIMPGVSIGENSIIGANSVVTKNIPSNCIAVGNPARILRKID